MSDRTDDTGVSPPSLRRAGALALAVLLLDQLTKAVIVRAWVPGSSGISVVPGFFRLVHFRNRGAAWGMMGEYPWLLLLFSVVALLFIVLRFRCLVEGSRVRGVFLGLLLGGIAGNLADRLLRGEVVDFLYFSLAGYHWPAFNVADSAICIGVFGFILASFTHPGPGCDAQEKECSAEGATR